MFRFSACILIVFIICPALFGQDSLSVPSKLSTAFRNTSFFSNNEYNSNYDKGYTIAGTWIKGGLHYKPSAQIEMEGGFYYRHFFGEPKTESYHPFYYRIKYLPNRTISLIFGDIYTISNHNLHEILYDGENNFLNPIEEGFLISYSGSKLLIETWVDWQKFIRINSPFQEQFVAGMSIKQTLITTKKSNIYLSFNGIAKHKGGEIDASPLSVSSVFNSHVMLTHSFRNAGSSIRNEFSTGYASAIKDSKLPDFPLKNGHGLIVENRFGYKNFSATTSYWHSSNFYSPSGNTIYSNFTTSTIHKKRNMLTLVVKWEKQIFPSALLCFKNDLYYDFEFKKPDLRSVLCLRIDLVTPFQVRKH